MDNLDSEKTRPSLLVRIRDAQDDQSWRTFVELYAPLIYRYCRLRGLQDADSADVGQEVLAQVAQSIRRFEYQPERGRFRDWLGTVTRNKVVRFLEGQGRPARGVGGPGSDEALETLGAPGGDTAWDAEFHAHVLRTALERIRTRVEPATWDAFQHVWIDGKSPLETARELGIPIDAVYLAKSRMLRRLRDEVMLIAEDLPLYAPLD
jgi:RNA polymerase sigma-70 factor (ECF subfamily)